MLLSLDFIRLKLKSTQYFRLSAHSLAEYLPIKPLSEYRYASKKQPAGDYPNNSLPYKGRSSRIILAALPLEIPLGNGFLSS